MKLEFLVLVKNDDSFCNSKKAFIDFLKVDSLISISGQKLTYRRSQKSKALISVKFRVETDNIPSNEERYFLVALENSDPKLVDEFSEAGNKIKDLCRRINPESTVINTLWDDIGRHYAYQAYPLINQVENVMRKLISKFMLINVGMEWSKETMHPDLAKKIERFDEDDIYLNDLYKLDFINLSDVLFQKKRDISLEDLDRVLSNTNFSEEDRLKILKYSPRSNWEKYFSTLLGENSQSLEKKWELLYKLRNKVAHNRFLTKQDFEKVKGLTTQVNDVLKVAINKLGEIDLNEEDRELIIHSYQYESGNAFTYLAEKSVAEYYLKHGSHIETLDWRKNRFSTDFIKVDGSERTAIEIKAYSNLNSARANAGVIRKGLMQLEKFMSIDNIDRGEAVIVLKEDIYGAVREAFSKRINLYREDLDPNIKIIVGFINEADEFEPTDL